MLARRFGVSALWCLVPVSLAAAQQSSWLHFGDVDGDGLDDALVIGAAGEVSLLANRGDGRFEDVTAASGLGRIEFASCALLADFDGDGRVDLFFGSSEQRLWRNDGKGVFTAMPSGVEHDLVDLEARALDHDRDGRLDLVLHTEAGDLFYRNAPTGRFERVELPDTDHPARSLSLESDDDANDDAADSGAHVSAARKRYRRWLRLRANNTPSNTNSNSSSVLSTPGMSSTSAGPLGLAGAPTMICAGGIVDQASGMCIEASSVGVLGQLHPLSNDFFVDSVNSRVGVGTSAPLYTLHVAGKLVSGVNTSASGLNAAVGGGESNTASGAHSGVLGGESNTAGHSHGFIGGGLFNATAGTRSVIGGGISNRAGNSSVVGGGSNNQANFNFSAVAGGRLNVADATYSTIGGGASNHTTGQYAFVGGGGEDNVPASGNVASGLASSIVGGRSNTASGDRAAIGGGFQNDASGNFATIGGGAGNSAFGAHSAIGGGYDNSSVTGATIGGGSSNDAAAVDSTIGGGYSNTTLGAVATIGGGESNTALGSRATIGGGLQNSASGSNATVGGGYLNSASGIYSAIAGGHELRADAYNAAAFGRYNVGGGDFGSWIATDPLFEIGNGSSDTSRANALTVLKNGKVGIGTTTPSYRLHVQDTAPSALGIASLAQSIGLQSASSATLGFGIGVWGITNYPAGHAGYFTGPPGSANYFERKVGIGTSSPALQLQVEGGSDVTPTGGGFAQFGASTGQNIAIDGNEIMARNNGVVSSLSLNADGGAVRVGRAGQGQISIQDDSLASDRDLFVSVARNMSMNATNTLSIASGSDLAIGSSTDVTISSATNNVLIASNVGVQGSADAAHALRVYGSAAKPGGGSWSVASDARLKKNVKDLDGALEQLRALRGVTYEYTDPASIGEPEGERIGFIAQEVERVFPDWVGERGDGLKYVSIRGFEALAVEALRELNDDKDRQIAELRAELAELRALLGDLRERVAPAERR